MSDHATNEPFRLQPIVLSLALIGCVAIASAMFLAHGSPSARGMRSFTPAAARLAAATENQVPSLGPVLAVAEDHATD